MFLCIHISVRVSEGTGYETKERSVREGRGVDIGAIGLMGYKSRRVTEGGGPRGG